MSEGSGGGGAAREAVLAAIAGRRSVRGYLPQEVPRATVERILAAAARAPSANNTQPWRVHVLTGAAKERLTAAIMAERAGGAEEPRPEYAYYPAGAWPEPCASRRRTLGWALYALVGIARGDRAAARAWHDRNFDFFGAPAGIIFTLDRTLPLASYLDAAMFAENVMIAARAFGLETCPQAAFASYGPAVRSTLGLGREELVLFGMALGEADPDAVANRLVADREPVAAFTVFHGD